MVKSQTNLQDAFLNYVRKENIPVTIFLINGYQLKGLVRGFDNFTIILECEGKEELVYKHVLSTIIPSRPVLEALIASQVKTGELEKDKE